jgi:hypothetical protein
VTLGSGGLLRFVPRFLRQQNAPAMNPALFDADWYRGQYSDVADAGIDPLTHYLEHGLGEGRSPTRSAWEVAEFTRGMFDGDWYLEHYADVAESGADPLLHYLNHGRHEGRHPNPAVWRASVLAGAAFDGDWYLRRYPDVAESGADPAEHFLLFGQSEGRFPTLDHARSSAWVRTFGVK